MKKLLNDPSAVVREMLEGLARLMPHVAILGDENVLVRRGLPAPAERPVAIISGGGSGHEPAHGGYVGAGMLSAAVCGEVFTSPSTDAVLEAIRATAGPNGALLIVKNYTGDRLNFGLAAELARAEGIPVEIVTVADDVSLRAQSQRNQRRGIAGTVLVHKIAGATAARGASLAQVAAAAREACVNLGTMGVALDGCTLPGADKAGFSLADDEIELGLGIHGEKGVERTAPMPADQLTGTLLSNIIEDLAIKSGERVALLVNGLGATPEMELAVVLRAAFDNLTGRNVTVERAWCGTLLSALNMPGCSRSSEGAWYRLARHSCSMSNCGVPLANPNLKASAGTPSRTKLNWSVRMKTLRSGKGSGAMVSPFMAGDGATAGNRILAAAPGIAAALSAATSIEL